MSSMSVLTVIVICDHDHLQVVFLTERKGRRRRGRSEGRTPAREVSREVKRSRGFGFARWFVIATAERCVVLFYETMNYILCEQVPASLSFSLHCRSESLGVLDKIDRELNRRMISRLVMSANVLDALFGIFEDSYKKNSTTQERISSSLFQVDTRLSNYFLTSWQKSKEKSFSAKSASSRKIPL